MARVRSPIANDYWALYPDELLSRFEAGERDFRRINLLRDEIEHIASTRRRPLDIPCPVDERFNVLWSDYRSHFDREFEWDSFGRFIPVEFDDLLPPRNLNGASLAEISLDGSYLYPVDFSEADLRRASFRWAMLIDVNLREADLSYADLRGATIDGDLTGANLYMARMDRCSIGGIAAGANFGRTKLGRANLTGLDLRGASLAHAHFEQTNLSRTDLRQVAFDTVRLNSVDTTGVKLEVGQIEMFLQSLSIVTDD